MKHISNSLLLTLMITSLSACKKFIQVGAPQTQTPASVVFSDPGLATGAMLNIYGQMMSAQSFCSLYTTLYCGQSADELINYSTGTSAVYYTNTLTASNNDDFWSKAYNYIYQANAVITGLEGSPNLTAQLHQQLTGEALFVRAFCHFYLVNLFGAVPYIDTTNYRVSNTAARMPAAQVYQNIIADLKQAQSLLTNNFPDQNNNPSTQRVRPNKGAATALLARVYLYTGGWSDAEQAADSVIASSNYTLLPTASMNAVFLMNSKEAIWQLQPSSPTVTNTYDAPAFIMTAPPSSLGVTVSLSNQLWNAFETGDQRKVSWVGTYTSLPGGQAYHYAYKYKVGGTSGSGGGSIGGGGGISIGGGGGATGGSTGIGSSGIGSSAPPTSEYYMVLRLAEQYLIRAEARAEQGNLQDAAADLNTIRTRAGLPNTTASTQSDLLAAILHERQVELFCEWGHRWLDLKRMGLTGTVLAPVKTQESITWVGTDTLYPIPLRQLQYDPAMANAQNPGY